MENNPIDLWDILGLDFIAVADRAVGGTVGLFYHYSLQYWKTSCTVDSGVEMKTSDLMARDKNAKKLGSVELLRQKGWEVWEFETKDKKKVWKIVDTSISVIHYSDSSKNLAAIYQGDSKKVKEKWSVIIKNAKAYDYAEQASFNGNFAKWPNSRYQMPLDSPFNNSNTFIRYLVKESGLKMIELGGSHPGAQSPSTVPNIYGSTPWKKGQTAPPSPATKP